MDDEAAGFIDFTKELNYLNSFYVKQTFYKPYGYDSLKQNEIIMTNYLNFIMIHEGTLIQ